MNHASSASDPDVRRRPLSSRHGPGRRDGTTIRVGICGTGTPARALVLGLDAADRVQVAKVLTRHAPSDETFPRPELLTSSLSELIESVDALFECSGQPAHAAVAIDAAFAAGLPVVTLDPIFQVTCGSYFVGRGAITELPAGRAGQLAALRSEVVEMGLRPLVYGSVKRSLNPNPTLAEIEYRAERARVSVPTAMASLDGTLLQAEHALIADWSGAVIAAPGMLGPVEDDLDAGARSLAEQAETLVWPITDYLLSDRLPRGVFIVAEPDERRALWKPTSADDAEYEIMGRAAPESLDLGLLLQSALLQSRPLLHNSARPRLSLGTVAKRPLSPGDRIARGAGGFELRGMAVQIADAPGHLPIGLVHDAVVSRPVAAGQLLTFDDLEVPDSLALHAWREIERLVLTLPE